jgi:hypothetical protein
MKTLKFLIALCIMLCFATNAVNAQPEIIDQWTEKACLYFPCMDEQVCGEWTFTRVYYEKISKFTVAGTFIGQETNTVYRFQHNEIIKVIWTPGQVGKWKFSTMLFADGKLIGDVNFLFHYTINALHETVVWKWGDMTMQCK